jgi:hypothetical protein
MTVSHSHRIPKTLLKPGLLLKYTTNGRASHTIYVAKKPTSHTDTGDGIYKVLNIWTNSRCGKCVYDRYTVIIPAIK